jgi:hypothetical protein
VKSKITDIKTGFNFLGATIRKYGKAGKFLMTPSKDNLLRITGDIREYIRSHSWLKTENLIHQLNWVRLFWDRENSLCFQQLSSDEQDREEVLSGDIGFGPG